MIEFRVGADRCLCGTARDAGGQTPEGRHEMSDNKCQVAQVRLVANPSKVAVDVKSTAG